MELTERKKKVLRSVVDLYIRTAEPVGSKAITQLPDMQYSSATIRNEMADLTEMGYLEQPHTSAGRVPSAAGYRLYVDELMADCQVGFSSYRPAGDFHGFPLRRRNGEAVRADFGGPGQCDPGDHADQR